MELKGSRTEKNLEAAFATISLPFILGDIIKCVMASMVGVALNKVIK